MLGDIELHSPEKVIWAILGLALWIVDHFYLFKKVEIKIPSNYLIKGEKVSKVRRVLLFTLAVIGWMFVAYSLAGPRKPVGRSNAKQEINDIYFVVDVSRSMLAEDFQPNRLEAAKDRIREFVKLSPVDRIGIVLFADKVFTLIPATTDLSLVSQSVDQINIGFLGSGTNIGDALGLAIARSKGSVAENKTIILLTDGASNVGLISPHQAAEKAAKNNIKIHTIGIGGDKNARLPGRRDALGRTRYTSIPGGSMDFKTLYEISEISGGETFIASDQGGLTKVLDEINKLERKKIEVSGRVVYEEMYWHHFLIGFSILLLVEIYRRLVLREVK